MVKRVLKEVVKTVPPVRRLLDNRDHYRTQAANLQAQNHELMVHRDQLIGEKTQLLQDEQNVRVMLSKRYIRGNGIEIGAAHMPLPVFEGAKVSYVDVAPTDEIRRRWPEVAKLDLVDVTIVDEGERLDTVINASQEFVIANHFLEHCLDPIGAIITQHRVLKPNGILYFAVPDKRHTFDGNRPLTTYQHLLQEHKYADERFRREHTEEYVRLAEKRTKSVAKRVNELLKTDYRPHFHVWTQVGIMELFIGAIRDFDLRFVFEAVVQNNHETIVVLRKLDTPSV